MNKLETLQTQLELLVCERDALEQLETDGTIPQNSTIYTSQVQAQHKYNVALCTNKIDVLTMAIRDEEVAEVNR